MPECITFDLLYKKSKIGTLKKRKERTYMFKERACLSNCIAQN